MRWLALTAVLMALVSLAVSPVLAVYGGGNANSGSVDEPNQIIVKFKPGVTITPAIDARGRLVTGHQGLDVLNERFHVRHQRALAGSSRVPKASHPLANVQVLRVESGQQISAMLDEYRKLDIVEFVEPDYRMKLMTGAPTIDPDPDPPEPNDPEYGFQWPLHNMGQSIFAVQRNEGCNNDVWTFPTGLADADIDYNEVYVTPPPTAADAVVAIIDTGVDTDNSDLSANIWHNSDEIAGNGIDDDKNGYIDDTAGWDFSANSIDWPTPQDNDPTDEYGHGTFCAGIVGAVRDNHKGIQGVCPRVKLMALKVYPAMTFSVCAEAIIYAADNGADVINMSWGSPLPSLLVQSALQYAKNSGVVLVAASGNSGGSDLFYPASFPEVISVGATDLNDHVTSFSTYGSELDLVAAGNDVFGLRADLTDMYAESCEPNVHIVFDSFYVASGTSFAAPHVAGAAGYMRAVSPGLSPAKVQQILQNNSDDLVDPYGYGWNLTGPDIYSGYGRLNLQRALAATGRVKTIFTAPTNLQVVSGTVAVRGTAAGFSTGSSYELGYSDTVSAPSWTNLKTSTTPVTNNLIYSWNTAGGALEGPQVLRLHSGDNYDYVTVFVVNSPLAALTSPTQGSTVSGLVRVDGSGACPNFARTVVQFKNVQENEWHPIATLYDMVWGGTLSYWNALGLPNGYYTLRVAVYNSQQQLVASQIKTVILENTSWSAPMAGSSARTANWGDFDRDGHKEIVVATANGVQFFDTEGVLKSTGMPTFPSGSYRKSPLVGNLDGDGYDDLVLYGNDGILHGRLSSGGSFDVQTGYVIGPDDNYLEYLGGKVYLRDINNDGLDEIHITDGELYAVFGPSGTPWGHGFPLQISGVARYLPADLNGDGVCELYAVTSGYQLQKYDFLSGLLVASVTIPNYTGQTLYWRDMSAVDMDVDNAEELVFVGEPSGYAPNQIYAYDDGLVLRSGWPHSTLVSSMNTITHPVFGDLTGDGVPECVIAVTTLDYGYVYAFNPDGTLLFAAPADAPGVVQSTPILADLDGNGTKDVMIAYGPSWDFMNNAEKLTAFNSSGERLSGFPLVVTANAGLAAWNMYIPTVGDFNDDGKLDVIYPSMTGTLNFYSFTGISFNAQLATCPMWRYDRRLAGTYRSLGNPAPRTVAGNEPSLPTTLALEQNYPNPFNPSTVISFALPKEGRASLVIYNLLGQQVRTLVDGSLEAGVHAIEWDGRETNGQPVASGVYLYRLVSGEFSQTRKMTLLK
jgi:subtilisin family serine protease